MIQRARDADFCFAIQNHFEHLQGSAGAQADHHFRIGGLVVLDHVRQKVGADGKRGGDAQRAADGRLQFVDGLARAGYIAQKLLGMRTQGLASRRNGEAAADAGEKLHSERIFERTHAGANGGLAYPESRCGAVKTAVSDYGEESFDLVDFHSAIPVQERENPFTNLASGAKAPPFRSLCRDITEHYQSYRKHRSAA